MGKHEYTYIKKHRKQDNQHTTTKQNNTMYTQKGKHDVSTQTTKILITHKNKNKQHLNAQQHDDNNKQNHYTQEKQQNNV